MRKFIFTTAALLSLSSNLFAVKVAFEGPTPENGNRIRRAVAGAASDTAAVNRAVTLLTEAGYLGAKVALEGGALLVDAGEKYLIEGLDFDGDSVFSVAVGEPFTSENISAAVDRELSRFRQQGQGHYFVSSRLVRVSERGQALWLHLSLHKGPTVRVATTIIEGLSRTDTSLVADYLAVEKGALLTESLVEKAQRRAGLIDYLYYRGPVQISPRPGMQQADLRFNFSEKKQVLLDGGGAYLPEQAGLVWHIDMTLRNIFGRGKQARVKSERRERGRNLFEVAYRQPSFLFGPGSLGLMVATRDYRDEFYEFSLSAEQVSQIGDEFSAGLQLGYRAVEFAGNPGGYRSYSVRFSVVRNGLNDRSNPSAGLALKSSLTFAHRRYKADASVNMAGGGSFNQTRSLLSANLYHPVAGAFIAHLGLNYAGLETSEKLPPISELFLIGGPPTLRGFRNEQFTALRTAYGTLEPRLRFKAGYLFSFYDGAYLNNRVSAVGDGVKSSESYHWSYGLGIAVVDRHRRVKLSFGWNREAAFDEPRLSIELTADI